MLFNHMLLNRANKTHQWCPSDSEDNYKPHQKDGSANYRIDSFDYKFNSDGFRCDEFSKHSDLPILFMGCSYTEGIGLPLEEVWSSHVLNKIKMLPQNKEKCIPYWSLAIGGTSIDTMARELSNYVDKVKPHTIFYLLSSFYRRELKYGSNQLRNWLPNYGINEVDLDKLYTDESYALYEAYRSLSIISLSVQKYNTKVFLFDLNSAATHKLEEAGALSFSNITYFQVDPSISGAEGRRARDNMHPGADWHVKVADNMQKQIKENRQVNEIGF